MNDLKFLHVVEMGKTEGKTNIYLTNEIGTDFEIFKEL